MPNTLELIQLPAGAHLFEENGPGDCAYLIKRGEIEVFVNRGERAIVLARRGAGEILGEMALIDQGRRSASARARSDCELVVLTAQQFAHRINQTDPILRMCLGVVIGRYRETLALCANPDAPPPPPPLADRAAGQDFHDAIQALTLERELECALRSGQFELYFQPIVDLGSYDLAGFEALIRWNHPERGLVPPSEFIPVAEASGLICAITLWCLREVARTFPLMSRQARERPRFAAGSINRPLFVCVNISSHDLLNPSFGTTVKDILNEGGMDAEDLKLEITESVLMKDPAGAGRVLQSCRREGMGIAVDDFGTGYSNLSYLSTLPITTLKIDRAFVRSIAEEGPSRKIVRTIRHLAHELDIPVVAEGIETEAQADALVAMNCEFGQGYLFSRPVPFERALDLIANWAPRRIGEVAPRRVAADICA